MNTTKQNTEDTTASPQSNLSHFKRKRGQNKLDEMLEDFHFRLVCDEEVIDFFEGVNTAFLKQHQRKLLALALAERAAPSSTGQDNPLLEALAFRHKTLFTDRGLSTKHFDIISSHLVETLVCLNVERSVMERAKANLRMIRAAFSEHGMS